MDSQVLPDEFSSDLFLVNLLPLISLLIVSSRKCYVLAPDKVTSSVTCRRRQIIYFRKSNMSPPIGDGNFSFCRETLGDILRGVTKDFFNLLQMYLNL